MNAIIRLPRTVRRKDGNAMDPGHTGLRTQRVYVIFTSAEATFAAARAAHELASAMHVPMTILHFRPVPYALPLSERTRLPNAETEALAARLRTEGIHADVCVYLCRSEREAALITLRPRSLVVVGATRAWFSGHAARWRRTLEGAGHAVVAVKTAHYSADRVAVREYARTNRVMALRTGVAPFGRGLVGHSMREKVGA